MKKLLFATLFFSMPAMSMNWIPTMAQNVGRYFWPVGRAQAQQDILTAAIFNDVQMARNALHNGATLNEGADLPIDLAICANSYDVAEFFLKHGADVNAYHEGLGRRPLHKTASANSPAIAQLLLANGATIDAQDIEGITPLELARMRHGEESEIYKLLLDEWRKRFQSSVKGIATENTEEDKSSSSGSKIAPL